MKHSTHVRGFVFYRGLLHCHKNVVDKETCYCEVWFGKWNWKRTFFVTEKDPRSSEMRGGGRRSASLQQLHFLGLTQPLLRQPHRHCIWRTNLCPQVPVPGCFSGPAWAQPPWVIMRARAVQGTVTFRDGPTMDKAALGTWGCPLQWGAQDIVEAFGTCELAYKAIWRECQNLTQTISHF